MTTPIENPVEPKVDGVKSTEVNENNTTTATIPDPTSNIDIEKLLGEVEQEQNKKLEQVKTEAINGAKDGMISQDVFKSMLGKVTEQLTKANASQIEALTKKMEEMNDKVIPQKSQVEEGVNPNSSKPDYNPWKDPSLSSQQKADLFFKMLKDR